MTVVAAGSLGAGMIGFLVVVALIAGCVFLFRSMLGHLRKVPPSFDPPPAADAAADKADKADDPDSGESR